MRRKFVCGIFALCLALLVVGCGKSSEEKQAANYYQKELGLDKGEAEELARELYGEDEEEQNVNEEGSEGTVVEPLPEIVNSEWYDCKVQVYDMVFDNFMYMTEEGIRKIVEGSAADFELKEDFDDNGEVRLQSLWVDSHVLDALWGENYDSNSNAVKYGLINEGYYYEIRYGSLPYYDKATIEFKDFNTRDDVLAYLNENGFVEVEENQAPYAKARYSQIPSDDKNAEYLDIPHYYCNGQQSITFYRMHKLGETDQVIEYEYSHRQHSGAHLNLVNTATFTFNTDGTIDAPPLPDGHRSYTKWAQGRNVSVDSWYHPDYYTMCASTYIFEILGEQID